MVEVDAQVLVGTAITVFLALLFFGVVVLWDVALALRSVGDKIDKLEDSVDDNLTEITHSLDGVSPGSGGTQLHLNGGGTISPGPTAGPVQQGQDPQQPQAGEQARAPAQQAGTGDGVHASSQPDVQDQQPQSPPASPGDQEPPRPDAEAETAADEDATEGAETTAVDESTAETTDLETEPDAETATADGTDDPRNRRNRGRFVTSPDRTAWYATPLDREAIAAAAQPSIAGELTDGSESGIDESEVIAAGPAPSDGATAPSGVDGTASDEAGDEETTETVDRSESDSEVDESGSVDEPETDADEATDAGDGEREAAEDAAEPDADASADSEGRSDEAETDDSDVVDEEASSDDGAADDADESSADAPTESEPSSGTDAGDDSESGEPEVLSYDESVDVADEPTTDALDSTDDESDDAPAPKEPADEDEVEPDRSEGGADRRTADERPSSETEPDSDDPENPFYGGGAGFEFDDISDLGGDEDDEEAISVEEAVDTMNEDAPAPSLSSHRFDVTAAEDGEGAVLTFEFDADTIEISGSTKRLLQYQMRSFADKESTPDGEVTIGRQRIVIEIPESDGTAVKQWGEAAVSIIDRTLYLSDNSGDE